MATRPPSVTAYACLAKNVRTSSLVPGRDADQPTVLGGEQNAPLTEPADHSALHLPGGRVGLLDGLAALRDGDGVGAGEEQTEAFGPLGQAAQVAAAVEQVVDELPPHRLLLPNGELLCPFMSLGEGVDRLLDSSERTITRRGGENGPMLTGHGQVATKDGPQPEAGLGGTLPPGPQGLQLVPGEAATRRAHLGQYLDIPLQILVGDLPPCHTSSCVLDALPTYS